MYFSEYYDEDEVYGHSYDDSYCVSPATGTVKHVNVKQKNSKIWEVFCIWIIGKKSEFVKVFSSNMFKKRLLQLHNSHLIEKEMSTCHHTWRKVFPRRKMKVTQNPSVTLGGTTSNLTMLNKVSSVTTFNNSLCI